MLEIKIYIWKGGMSMMARRLLYLVVLSLFFSIETRLAFFSLFFKDLMMSFLTR